jgi:hypothetical protein
LPNIGEKFEELAKEYLEEKRMENRQIVSSWEWLVHIFIEPVSLFTLIHRFLGGPVPLPTGVKGNYVRTA